MIKIFICAFSYKKTNNELPAIALDVWRMYNVFNKNWKDSIFYFVTDMKSDTTYNISSAIKDKQEVNDFINKAINNKISNLSYIKSKNLNNIKSLVCNDCDGNYVFYFTGHGEKNGLIFPDDIVTPSEILETFVRNNVLILLDCCAIYDIGLPYMNNSKFYKKSTTKSNKALCMTASTDYNDALSSRKGSLFTEAFYKILKNEDKNFIDLKNTIESFIQYKYNISQPVVVSYNNKNLENIRFSQYFI
jgi:hypothetical protein